MRYLLFFNVIATMSDSNYDKLKENQTTTTTTSNVKSSVELAEEAIEALMRHMQFVNSPNTKKFFESQAEFEKCVKELEEEAKKCRDQN